MKKMFLIMTIALTIFSCKDKNEDPTIKVDFDITINDTFQVELTSNQTTGYSWKWSNSETLSIIDSIDYSYVQDTPILDGSGGKEIWKFKGQSIGIDSLKFEYCRSWEENSTIEKKNYIVRVK